MIFAKNLPRNCEKKYLEHQTLGWWVVCPKDQATQRIILKIVGFRVVAENAELSSTLSETRHKLDSEIRVRENRDAKLLLDTQGLF